MDLSVLCFYGSRTAKGRESPFLVGRCILLLASPFSYHRNVHFMDGYDCLENGDIVPEYESDSFFCQFDSRDFDLPCGDGIYSDEEIEFGVIFE